MPKYTITNGELCHYGVKGMKWGVRRDLRILASSRRNKKVRDARKAYKAGKITKDQRKAKIAEANKLKKDTIKDAKAKYAKAKTSIDRKRVGEDITNKTLKEVPNAQLKRGALAVNRLLGSTTNALTVGSAALSVALNPALAGVAVSAAAVSIATEIGKRYCISRGMETLF